MSNRTMAAVCAVSTIATMAIAIAVYVAAQMSLWLTITGDGVWVVVD
jgi:hypothetical protein